MCIKKKKIKYIYIVIKKTCDFVDEYKIAIGHRLAVMTESNIALEKTVVEIRKEIIDRPLAKENVAESVHPVSDDGIFLITLYQSV